MANLPCGEHFSAVRDRIIERAQATGSPPYRQTPMFHWPRERAKLGTLYDSTRLASAKPKHHSFHFTCIPKEASRERQCRVIPPNPPRKNPKPKKTKVVLPPMGEAHPQTTVVPRPYPFTNLSSHSQGSLMPGFVQELPRPPNPCIGGGFFLPPISAGKIDGQKKKGAKRKHLIVLLSRRQPSQKKSQPHPSSPFGL